VVDQGALDLHRADPVSRDVQDVVDAAEEPEISLPVASGPVARKIETGAPFRPVGPDMALGVAIDRFEHGGPGTGDRQIAAALLDHATVLVEDLGADPGEGPGRRARPGRRDPGERCDHDHAGLGLPPGVDDRAAPPADLRLVPDPGFGIDRLADAAEQAQRGEVMFPGHSVPQRMQARTAVGAV